MGTGGESGARRLLPDDDERARLDAYAQFSSDREAAIALGISRGTYAQWRQHRGLPRMNAARGLRVPAAEDQRRLEAYRETSNDREAARRVGVTAATFSRWRRKRDLPAKQSLRRRLTPEEQARRREAYEATRNDAEAAEALGITPTGFAAWRRQRELPAKSGSPVAHAPRGLPDDEEGRRLDAYDETGSDAEAARRLGLAHITFQMWRQRRGLPNKYVRTLDDAEDARRHKAYEREPNDAAAARALGIDRRSFTHWRHRQCLPVKARPPTLPADEEARRRRAYEATGSDEGAADRLGVTLAAFAKWRATRGLPKKNARRATRSRPPPGPTAPPQAPPRRGNPLPEAQELLRRQAYERHAGDEAAARALGLSISAFRLWRRTRGLSPRRPEQPPIGDGREEARWHAAYAREATDAAAAQALGVPTATFVAWRRSRHLPLRPPSTRLPAEEEERRMRAYHDNPGDEEAAEALGVPTGTFTWWRGNRALPRKVEGTEVPPNRCNVPEEEDARRQRAYDATRCDAEAARHLGLPRGTFASWRRRRGIPSKVLPLSALLADPPSGGTRLGLDAPRALVLDGLAFAEAFANRVKEHQATR